MGYVDDNLVPGETVACRARPHWLSFAPFLIGGPTLDLIGVVLVVRALLGHGTGESPARWMIVLGAICVLAGSAVLAMGVVLWRSIEITVTSRRVFVKTGIVRRHTTEILLSKVESVSIEETLAGRLMGFGRVTIHGTGGTPESFDRIAGPHEFRRQIQIQIEGLSLPR
jgi:uncharacterized membrane protein YdbT with pleckstrin-like domain